MSRVWSAIVLVVMLVGPALAAGRDLGPQAPGRFDYYVLSLTWVPGFCATNGSDPGECAKGLGFALHGLWPQDEGGDYPSNCGADTLTPSERATYAPLYASPSLIAHEWPKHGTCAGLAAADYFDLSKADVAKVVIPEAYRQPRTIRSREARAVEQAFIAANPTLPPGAVQVVSTHGVVEEVHLCLTKAGDFRVC